MSGKSGRYYARKATAGMLLSVSGRHFHARDGSNRSGREVRNKGGPAVRKHRTGGGVLAVLLVIRL